eukprot:3597806-Pyramimonas_sp.AAC.1
MTCSSRRIAQPTHPHMLARLGQQLNPTPQKTRKIRTAGTGCLVDRPRSSHRCTMSTPAQAFHVSARLAPLSRGLIVASKLYKSHVQHRLRQVTHTLQTQPFSGAHGRDRLRVPSRRPPATRTPQPSTLRGQRPTSRARREVEDARKERVGDGRWGAELRS